MLTRDGVIGRLILAVSFFFAPASGLVSGWLAAICGIMGIIQVGSAVLRYSPLKDLWQHYEAVWASRKASRG